MTQQLDDFSSRWTRMINAIGGRNLADLARELGIRPAMVSDALRRKWIPAEWLNTLARRRGINPNWISDGNGAIMLSDREREIIPGNRRRPDLKHIPVILLVREYLRRISDTRFPDTHG